MSLGLLLLILALIAFVIAAIGRFLVGPNWIAIGLALWVASILFGAVTVHGV